jgi:hypothetical protein
VNRPWISLGELTQQVARLQAELGRAGDATEQALAQVKCLQDELAEMRQEVARLTQRLAIQSFSAEGKPLATAEDFVALKNLATEPAAPRGLPQVCEALPGNTAFGVKFKARACFKVAPPQAGDRCDALHCSLPAAAPCIACDAYPDWALYVCALHLRIIDERTSHALDGADPGW